MHGERHMDCESKHQNIEGGEKLIEIEEARKTTRIDIMGIAEVRREGNRIIETFEGNILCYTRNKG